MQIEYLTCSDGKRRKAIRINCLNCGKEHLSRLGKNKTNEFCSKECVHQHSTKTTVEIECDWCKALHKKAQSKLKNSKSGFRFCSRKCKDAAQKLGGIKEIQPKHFGTALIPDYRSMFLEEEMYCNRCGYKEFLVSVQIHHIDEDRTNNHKDNLIPLCSNCHDALHHNNWKFNEIR